MEQELNTDRLAADDTAQVAAILDVIGLWDEPDAAMCDDALALIDALIGIGDDRAIEPIQTRLSDPDPIILATARRTPSFSVFCP